MGEVEVVMTGRQQNQKFSNHLPIIHQLNCLAFQRICNYFV